MKILEKTKNLLERIKGVKNIRKIGLISGSSLAALAVLAAVLILADGGGGGYEPEPVTEPDITAALPEPTTEPAPEDPDYGPEEYDWWEDYDFGDLEHEDYEQDYEGERVPPRFINFLTGLESTRARQLRRPVAIIINNDRQAQPTVGVGAGEIIYETLIEGGITRLLMLVTDFPGVPVFGSIRSARDFHADFAQGHDAIFVHAGGTTLAYTELNTRGVDRLDGVNAVRGRHFPDTFYRDAERRRTMAFEHTLMASGEGILTGIRQAGYRRTHERDFQGSFRFSEYFQELPYDSNTAYFVQVPFASNTRREFIFNPEDGLYYRRQFGAPHIDGATGEQLRFENVIIMFTEYTTAQGFSAGDMSGSGFGFYVTGGRFITIRWSKDARGAPLYFFNLDGSDLYLNPGRTFICVTTTAFNRSVVINADLHEIG